MQQPIKQFDRRDSILSATKEAIDSIDEELLFLYQPETQRVLNKYGFDVDDMIQDWSGLKEDVFQLKQLPQVTLEVSNNKQKNYTESNKMDNLNNEFTSIIQKISHCIRCYDKDNLSDWSVEFASGKTLSEKNNYSKLLTEYKNFLCSNDPENESLYVEHYDIVINNLQRYPQ